MRTNITAVMIVKNEEANLEKCLKSIDGMMPIKIADTGSTDRTMEIARDYGADVYEHLWQDSFSESRNWLLPYIQTPWAIQIDADETFVEPTVSALDKLDDNISAYHTPIHNLMPNGAMSMHHFERIYQPTKIHYKWRVHNEVIIDEGEASITDFSFMHYGYAVSEEELQRKFAGTLRLLMLDIDDAGYVPRNVRYLIQTYRSLQRHADVLKVIDEHITKLEEWPGVYQEAVAGAIVAHNAVGDNPKAKVAGLKLLNKFPHALDALFYLGVVYIEDQAWDLSLECFGKYVKTRRALQLEGVDSTISYHTWGNLAESFQNMGICASMRGDKPNAALFFMRAEMLAGHRPDIAGYAANTDQAMCLLADEARPTMSNIPDKLVKLTGPGNASPITLLETPVPRISGKGVVITKD